jgi:hypothetical protein
VRQRFKIGGDRLGRSYEVAEIAGDQGIGAKVEVRQVARRADVLERVAVYGLRYRRNVETRDPVASLPRRPGSACETSRRLTGAA